MIRNAALSAAAALAVTAVFTSAAEATSVETRSDTIVVEGDAGETNKLLLSTRPGVVVIEDTNNAVDLSLATGCTQEAPNRVACNLTSSDRDLEVRPWTENDEVTSTMDGAEYDELMIYGGQGDDTLRGGDGGAYLTGEDGKDKLYGGASNDVVSPGDGEDTVDTGAGDDYITLSAPIGGTLPDPRFDADVIRGGDGEDRLILGDSRTDGVRVTPDNQPNDGSVQENDDYGSDVELIRGTKGPDEIHIVPQGVKIVEGMEGDDVIYGSDNDDGQIQGNDGNDTIYAGAGNDLAWGGTGNDTIVGGPGEDAVIGDTGNDTLDTRDLPEGVFATTPGYRDHAHCGDGWDINIGDEADGFGDGECEDVRRSVAPKPPAPPAPSNPPAATPPPVVASLAAKTGKLVRGKAVTLTVGCPASATTSCVVKLRLRFGKKLVANASARVKPGKTATVKANLNSSGRKLAKKKRSLKLTVYTLDQHKTEFKLGTITAKR